MALTVSFTTKTNEVATYARIENVRNKPILNAVHPSPIMGQTKTLLNVSFWKDADTRTQAKEANKYVSMQNETYPSDQVFTDVPSAYTFLKTLPQFKDATDC